MKFIGIAGMIGVALGIGVAEWLRSPNDTVYYAVLGIGGVIGLAVGKAMGGKKPAAKPPEGPK